MKKEETIYKETKELKQGVTIHYNPITKQVYDPYKKNPKKGRKKITNISIIVLTLIMLIILFCGLLEWRVRGFN